MQITNIQITIVGLILIALILALKEQYGFVIAIVTLLGGILIPSPLTSTNGDVPDAGKTEPE